VNRMSPFGPFDMLDTVPREASPTGDRNVRASAPRVRREPQPPRQHWWSTFDGWRIADLDAEFSLA